MDPSAQSSKRAGKAPMRSAPCDAAFPQPFLTDSPSQTVAYPQANASHVPSNTPYSFAAAPAHTNPSIYDIHSSNHPYPRPVLSNTHNVERWAATQQLPPLPQAGFVPLATSPLQGGNSVARPYMEQYAPRPPPALLAPVPVPAAYSQPVIQHYERIAIDTPNYEHWQYRNDDRLSSTISAGPASTPLTEQATPPANQPLERVHNQSYNPDNYPIPILEQIYQTLRPHVHDPPIDCEECARKKANFVHLPIPSPVERHGLFAGTRASNLPAFYIRESAGIRHDWKEYEMITLPPFRFQNENEEDGMEDGAAAGSVGENNQHPTQHTRRVPLPHGWAKCSGMGIPGEVEEQRVWRAVDRSGSVLDLARQDL